MNQLINKSKDILCLSGPIVAGQNTPTIYEVQPKSATTDIPEPVLRRYVESADGKARISQQLLTVRFGASAAVMAEDPEDSKSSDFLSLDQAGRLAYIETSTDADELADLMALDLDDATSKAIGAQLDALTAPKKKKGRN